LILKKNQNQNQQITCPGYFQTCKEPKKFHERTHNELAVLWPVTWEKKKFKLKKKRRIDNRG